MPKEPFPVPTPPVCRESLGIAPAVLAKRDFIKANPWCPVSQHLYYILIARLQTRFWILNVAYICTPICSVIFEEPVSMENNDENLLCN